MKWQNHEGDKLYSANGYHVIDCEYCGFKHIVPIPSDSEIRALYEEDYYSKEKPQYIQRAKADLDWLNLGYEERYRLFEQFLSSNRRRILDIGSGPGFFLAYGKKRGWYVVGIEPSYQAVSHSRTLGLEVIHGFFDTTSSKKLKLEYGNFDVIHLQEVLEHIANPCTLLKSVYDLLAPQGLVCIIVPNDFNPFQLAIVQSTTVKPWWIAPPHHINYFDRHSLCNLLEKNRFSILHVEATFPIDIFLLFGENYIHDDVTGRCCHYKRKRFEYLLKVSKMNALKQALYKKLAELDLGREIMVIAQRN